MNLDSCFRRKPWIPAPCLTPAGTSFAGMTKMGKRTFYEPSYFVFSTYKNFICVHLRKSDGFAKSPESRHSCESRSPELFELTGFPLSRERRKWVKRTSYEFIKICVQNYLSACNVALASSAPGNFGSNCRALANSFFAIPLFSVLE